MVWFRFTKSKVPDPYGYKKKEVVIYKAEEMELDMHSDENLNRVFTKGLDHTLVIKDVKPSKYTLQNIYLFIYLFIYYFGQSYYPFVFR